MQGYNIIQGDKYLTVLDKVRVNGTDHYLCIDKDNKSWLIHPPAIDSIYPPPKKEKP